jgi:EspG family
MRIDLSLAALDILWDDLRLGQLPFPLEVRSHGETVGVRAQIRAAVYADLVSRGLATGTRPDDGLVEKLRLLAEPQVSVDLVALLDLSDTEPLMALAVARGRHGLVATQRKLTVSLRGMRGELVVATLVDMLPRTPAGQDKSVTRPAAAFQKSRNLVHAGGVLRTVTGPDSGRAARPVLRAGQLGVTRIDESGRRQREPGIGWFDTEEGRYATTITAGPDGADWVTVWPADNARLAHRLSEAVGR